MQKVPQNQNLWFPFKLGWWHWGVLPRMNWFPTLTSENSWYWKCSWSVHLKSMQMIICTLSICWKEKCFHVTEVPLGSKPLLCIIQAMLSGLHGKKLWSFMYLSKMKNWYCKSFALKRRQQLLRHFHTLKFQNTHKLRH